MKAIRVFAVVLAVIVAVGIAAGQTSEGRILGTVLDPSGAVIAGARITITNTRTGVTRELTSTGNGEYVAPLITRANSAMSRVAPGACRKMYRSIDSAGLAVSSTLPVLPLPVLGGCAEGEEEEARSIASTRNPSRVRPCAPPEPAPASPFAPPAFLRRRSPSLPTGRRAR